MGVKRRDHMKEITKEALLEALKLRDTGEHPAFRECEFKDMDLSGAWCFSWRGGLVRRMDGK